MAETLLSSGVHKLWDLLVRESERFHGVDKQFTELKSSINYLTSFLKDAEAKKHTYETVKNCVEEMKEIVFDAEDVIETFLLKEQLGEANGIRNRVKRLAFIITDRRELTYEMEDISKRISKVITDMKSFGVIQVVFNGGYSSESRQERVRHEERERRQTFSSENESFLVGLENNIEKLVRYLVEEDDINQVVSITGMGGIGKTTLARQVFNHEIVKNHFENVAWVCVSQELTRKVVWETMLRNLSRKHDQERRELEMSDDELQDKLFRLLEKSKCSLIVLDDVWKEEDWDRIKPVFPPTKGWKVLLTSRNEGVALRADPKCIIFRPDYLTPQESWKLFQNMVFPKKDGTESKLDAEMEQTGEQMMKHCGGLPLAIKLLGGLLAAQYTLHEWKRVYENIGSQLSNENTSSIHHVLSLSFEELPVYLKHCFLYLAHFPEDYAIDIDQLSYYWAAEKIPKPRHYNGWTILDVGQGYIEELVKRNMVISQRDIKTGRFKECQLHDMMREVCLLKAEQENFLQIVGNQTDTLTANSRSSCRPRRLIIYRPHERFDPERYIKNPKLRSLLFYLDSMMMGWMASGLCFKKLKLLRVLCLSEAEFESKKLPSGIGKLIHLRYLSLNMTTISHIPYSLRNLKLLLYLNLAISSDPIYVPNIFKEMQELRYLYLPDEIDGKTKLELGNLVNLETLENFSTKNSNVKDLRSMTKLLKLSIFFNGGCTMETLSSSLRELRHLEHLEIRDYKGNLENLTIHMVDATRLVFDCVNLNKLVLSIYMPRLPDEKHFPSCLTSIQLTQTCLEEDPMPILEKLLHLTKVSLWDRSFGGKRMVCSANGFPKLEELVICRLEEWEEWIVEERSMPLLHTLTISRCLKLKELPEGMRFMISLKELCISRIELEFKEKLEEEGEDYYKIQHIPCVRLSIEDIMFFGGCSRSEPESEYEIEDEDFPLDDHQEDEDEDYEDEDSPTEDYYQCEEEFISDEHSSRIS